MTSDGTSPLIRLQDLPGLPAHGGFDDGLRHLAEMVAAMLEAGNCSIMLLDSGEADSPRMRVCASCGVLPEAAYGESAGKGEGIAGRVIASGRSLLVADISRSEFAGLARHAGDPRKSLMSSPIRIDRHIVGVVNVSGQVRGDAFGQEDLGLLEVAALFVGKSIQAIQLQAILNSRFAQMAMLKEAENNLDALLGSAVRNPDQVAKILAKSFYKEMTRAGFGASQIIHAASEIIAQLSGSLQRHNRRMTRGPAARMGGGDPGKPPGRS